MIRKSSTTKTSWHKNKEYEVWFLSKKEEFIAEKIVVAVVDVDKKGGTGLLKRGCDVCFYQEPSNLEGP